MTPVFYKPVHIYDAQVSRVFHRDYPGRIVVVFMGPDHRQNALEFCQQYGEADGSKKLKQQGGSNDI